MSTRSELVRAVAAWHYEGVLRTRRDFELAARRAAKAITNPDLRWLETTFDLERLRVERFAPVGCLAGDLVLRWDDVPVHLKPLHCLGLPLADMVLADSASHTSCWSLIENRASVEWQARKRNLGVALVWMPGRPSSKWFEAIRYLLRLAPASMRISADADPAGVDIACKVGKIWQDEGLSRGVLRVGLYAMEQYNSTLVAQRA